MAGPGLTTHVFLGRIVLALTRGCPGQAGQGVVCCNLQKKSRKKLVWEFDRQLQGDAARPIIYQ